MKKANIHFFEIEELACKITGLDYDDIDSETIDEKLQDEFGCDILTFTDIISRLLPLIDIGTGLLSDDTFKGFADIQKEMWFVKIKIEQ